MKKSPASGGKAASDGWTPWRPTVPPVKISTEILAETLGGGQAFRWRKITHPDGEVWQGVWGDWVARLRVGSEAMVEWSAPTALNNVATAVEDYLAAEVDFVALANQLPWRTDAVLEQRIRAWTGLRLLRQPLGETLLAFLCSSAKQIPHIAQLCEKMAERFGEPIWGDVRALPTWTRLAEVPESELRACSLGYRAAFVKHTAARLAKTPNWEAKIKAAPHAEAQAWLAELPGVGPKIADCVLLFGAAKFEAFPVDTWILKAMAGIYGLDGWRPAQVAQFGRAHFGPLAGLGQQFLFSGARRAKSRA